MEDRSLVGQQEVGMPARQPKCSSIGTQPALDTGRWSCCSLVSNHTQRSWISSAPHEHVSRLTAVEEPGLRLVSTSPGGSSSCGLAQSLFDSVSPGLALLRVSVTCHNSVPCFHPPSLHLF